jgi:MoaA/NifB/PqqE/SkfB family radical SAM enzyme
MLNNFRKNSPLILDLMGGEPTLWPEFESFCHAVNIHPEKTSIQFTSNGSRTVRYWENFSAPIDTLGFSFHPEFATEDHYFKILRVLHNKYNVKVFLMMPPQYYERIKQFYYDIANSDLNIDVAIKLIKDNKGGGLIPGYNEEHKAFSLNRLWKSKIDIIDDLQPLYNEIPFTPQNLINEGKDKFKGWNCNMGIDRIAIQSNGDVYGSTCYITPPYGNINKNEEIIFPVNPTLCTREYCGCGADISISKSCGR